MRPAQTGPCCDRTRPPPATSRPCTLVFSLPPLPSAFRGDHIMQHLVAVASGKLPAVQSIVPVMAAEVHHIDAVAVDAVPVHNRLEGASPEMDAGAAVFDDIVDHPHPEEGSVSP